MPLRPRPCRGRALAGLLCLLAGPAPGRRRAPAPARPAPAGAFAGPVRARPAVREGAAAGRRCGAAARAALPPGAAALPAEVAGAAGAAAELAWLAASGAAVLYVVISFTEYAYHRYVQHLDLNRVGLYQLARQVIGAPAIVADFHMAHHRETLDDMSIDPLPKDAFPDVTVHRGTAATWFSFIKMACIVMLQAYIPLSLLGWTLPAASAAVLLATLLHLRAYNSLHPQLHGLPAVAMAQGPPSILERAFVESAYARWLREYHVIHHRSRATRNFNVCCPLVDHLLGTHAEAA